VTIELMQTDFPGAGRARDHEVGHLGEVRDERLARDVAPERDRQLRLRRRPVLALEQLAHPDGRRVQVRDLHADRGLAGDGREDADGLRAHAERDVLVEAGDLLHAHAGRGHDLVAGDHGAHVDLAERHLDAEFAQDPQQRFRVVPVLLVAVAGGRLHLLLEELERGKLIVRVGGLGRTTLAFFGSSGLTIVSSIFGFGSSFGTGPGAASFGGASGAVGGGPRRGPARGPRRLRQEHLLRGQVGPTAAGAEGGEGGRPRAALCFAALLLALVRSAASAAFRGRARPSTAAKLAMIFSNSEPMSLGDDKEQAKQ
jgi:hypothetical protein